MESRQELQAKRREILRQIASLGEMRRGTVTEQYVEAERRDGTRVRRGPYPVYTFKEKGKTVSRRVKSPAQLETYRTQIKAFRRFQELTGALMKVCEELADLSVGEPEAQKKTPRPRSKES